MQIDVQCGYCKRRYMAPATSAGQPVRCPGCQAVFIIPCHSVQPGPLGPSSVGSSQPVIPAEARQVGIPQQPGPVGPPPAGSLLDLLEQAAAMECPAASGLGTPADGIAGPPGARSRGVAAAWRRWCSCYLPMPRWGWWLLGVTALVSIVAVAMVGLGVGRRAPDERVAEAEGPARAMGATDASEGGPKEGGQEVVLRPKKAGQKSDAPDGQPEPPPGGAEERLPARKKGVPLTQRPAPTGTRLGPDDGDGRAKTAVKPRGSTAPASELSEPSGTGLPWSVVPDPAPRPEQEPATKAIPLWDGPVRQVVFSRRDAGRVVLLRSFHGALGDRARAPSVPDSLRPLPASAPCWIDRYDLFTGESIDRLDLDHGCELLDASADAGLVLLRAGTDRLEVWSVAEGEPICDFRPYDNRVEVVWAALVDPEHVLTLSEDPRQLVLWKLPECRPEYYLAVDAVASVVLSPGRKHLVVLRGGTPWILEVPTGKWLGKVTLPPGLDTRPWATEAAAFSADGTRLAIAWRGDRESVLLVWDVGSGRLALDLDLGLRSVGGVEKLQWCGPGRLAVHASVGTEIVDLDRKAVVWRNQYSKPPLYRTPDQRLWFVFEGYSSRCLFLAGAEALDQKAREAIDAHLPEDVKPLFGPGVPVSLDCSHVTIPYGSAEIRSRIEADLTAMLRQRKVELVAGADLRLCAVSLPGPQETVEYEFLLGRQVVSFSYPSYEVRLGLLAADGAVLWERTERLDPARYDSVHVRGTENVGEFLRRRHVELLSTAIGDFFRKARIPRNLYSKAGDSDAMPGLGRTDYSLARLFGVESPPTRDLRARGEDPDQRASREQYERAARQRNRQPILEALVDDAAVRSRLRWVPALGRPVLIAARWGVGVQPSGAKDTRAGSESRSLISEAGPAAGNVLRELERRLMRGVIDPSSEVDRRLLHDLLPLSSDVEGVPFRYMTFLGHGPHDQLLAAAQRQGLDLVLIVNVTLRTDAKKRKLDPLVRLRLADVDAGKVFWVSESLPGSYSVPSRRRPAGRSGTDLVKDAVDEVMQRIDEDCMPRSLPKLTAEQVDERLNQIDPAALFPDAALHVLLELRYYQLQRLVPDDRAFSLFDAILGPGQGRAFVDGNEAKRRTLLATWLKAKPG